MDWKEGNESKVRGDSTEVVGKKGSEKGGYWESDTLSGLIYT